MNSSPIIKKKKKIVVLARSRVGRTEAGHRAIFESDKDKASEALCTSKSINRYSQNNPKRALLMG